MVSKETSLLINISNSSTDKDFYMISRKMLYKKYSSGNYSLKNILTDYILFNSKCRLTLFFKEFLLSDNSCEFLRHFYSIEDTKNILSKILEIYSLYSKIYPNYIILRENKFLYKNIRKKQKMIDEYNETKKMKKNNSNENNGYKENELFTLSVRNEIKEFEDNSYMNKNNNDSTSNKNINSKNTKKINDNWMLINNKNPNNSKKIKNMSFDSFWTNDTNNLSTILNAINDKIFLDDSNSESKTKKRDISHKIKNRKGVENQKKKEVKSSKKKSFKKLIYKKIENKKILSDNSRNNSFLKMKKKQIYLHNLNTTKPLSSSLSNKKNWHGLGNKGENIGNNHLLTEKNMEKEIKKNFYQYFSIERDKSDKYLGNYLKKLNPSITTNKKFYSKENKSLSVKKNNENNLLKNSKNISNNKKYEKIKRKKSQPHEFLKIFLDDTKKIGLNYIKEENEKNSSFNNKKLYNTNNNFNILRNKQYFLKKYFTNNNFKQKIANRRYTNNLTECNSQIIFNSNGIKEFNSTCNNNEYKKTSNNNNGKTLNNFHTSNNYYILKHKNVNTNSNIEQKKLFMKKQKTDGTFLSIRDKILQRGMGTTYIKKKCFSPLSNNYNRKYTLSKSCNFKEDNLLNNIKNEKLIERQMINSDVKNKLIDFRKNIRKQIIHHDNNYINEKTFISNKSINKINNSNNILIMDESQKENKSNLNNLNIKENYRNNKKIYLKKNFSLTLTYYNLYKSGAKNSSKSKNNFNNNSEFIEYHHEKLYIKRKNNITNNDSSKNLLENKENNYRIMNLKKSKIKERNHMTKSRTEYENFRPKYKNINKLNNQKKETHNNFILRRLKNKSNNFYLFSKDKINKSNNLNDVAFQRFNNLSNSAINNNNSNYQELTSTKTNNSLSNSMNNIKELQTPLIIKRRLKLIKKFMNRDQKEKKENISNIENIPSKVAIKVNRTKFFERVKEKMKNRINLNQI